MEQLLTTLKSREESGIVEALKNFCRENERAFSFPQLEQTTIRKQFWELLISSLKDPALKDTHLTCLQTIRILSRDRKDLNEVLNTEVIETLLVHAILKRTNTNLETINPENVFEAQKCLFNLIFNSIKGQQLAVESDLLFGIVGRLQHHGEPQLTHSIKFFDLRILAVLLSLNAPCRSTVRFVFNGIPKLARLIESLYSSNLTDEAIELCGEALTALFPLLLPMEPPKIVEVGDRGDCEVWEDSNEMDQKLINIIRPFLVADLQSNTKKEELHSKIINLMNNVNPRNYIGLVPNGNFAAIDAILSFLDTRLDKAEGNLREMLMPVLNFLRDACLNHGVIRRYVRIKVLPPLRDVSERPEVGLSLRNKLCRLMTSPNWEVAAMVAEFLFVLCKENMARLVKYTGFGNAAGLLANRGLMRGQQKSSSNPNYSSDSENSDTEEYEKIRDRVNPVLGCYEPPHGNPMEGMSEDQKEYEAVKLVNLMDRLHKMGVVQPATIGEDGKPHAVEHILQLQESLPQRFRAENQENEEDD